MTDRPIAEGDTVRLKGVWGLWNLERIHPVSGEATVRRGKLVRRVPTDQLQTATKDGAR